MGKTGNHFLGGCVQVLLAQCRALEFIHLLHVAKAGVQVRSSEDNLGVVVVGDHGSLREKDFNVVGNFMRWEIFDREVEFPDYLLSKVSQLQRVGSCLGSAIDFLKIV